MRRGRSSRRRDYFALLRAESALTAYRTALALLRHKDRRDAERLILLKINEKKASVEEWRRQYRAERQAQAAAVAEADYREANAALLEDEF